MEALERVTWEIVMKRYGIRTYDELLEGWSKGRVYLALDAIFWAEPKERDKWRASAGEIRTARAAEVFGMLGM